MLAYEHRWIQRYVCLLEVKTADSVQWHFVYRGWLRCERPLLEISTIAKKITDAQERLEEWKLERRKLEVDVLHWQEQLMAAQERPADYTRVRRHERHSARHRDFCAWGA